MRDERYRWETVRAWLDESALTWQDIGPLIIDLIEEDDLQDIFQDLMEAEGFFSPIPNDVLDPVWNEERNQWEARPTQ